MATIGLWFAPIFVASSATRDWPGGGGDAAAEGLLSALDELVNDESDAIRRSSLARLRDTSIDIDTKTLAELVSKSGRNAV